MIDEKFIFTGTAKTRLLILMVVGFVLLALGIFAISRPDYGVHHGSGHGDAHAPEAYSEVKSTGHDTPAFHNENKEHSHAPEVKSEHADAGHSAHAEGHHTAIWIKRILKNLWQNNVFFAGISVIG